MKTKNIVTRIAALGVAGLMLVASLTGCGSKKEGANVSSDSTSSVQKLEGKVATDGSTSMEKVIGALGEAFKGENDGVTFTYNPTGSGTGITAVSEDRCDIGLSSRALKDEEVEKGLNETILAYDGIAVIVNNGNNVDDLTIETIAKIYKGEITNWKEIGGDDAEIVLIGREPNSGTRDGFESVVGVEDECKYRQELTATGDVISAVAGNPNAIGYASVASVKDTVKALKVEGVAPDTDTIKDGTYKIQRPFVLVTKTDTKLSDTAQAFYDFCLSEEAKDIITGAGVVPAN
ncbi:MAG: phosphate ABC transporter substrate-binding protein [Acutalibacteraceae bacterium]|nr:phosphate ABC transporter substrate-binding protein [Acutalibacteraceae bacterium]